MSDIKLDNAETLWKNHFNYDKIIWINMRKKLMKWGVNRDQLMSAKKWICISVDGISYASKTCFTQIFEGSDCNMAATKRTYGQSQMSTLIRYMSHPAFCPRYLYKTLTKNHYLVRFTRTPGTSFCFSIHYDDKWLNILVCYNSRNNLYYVKGSLVGIEKFDDIPEMCISYINKTYGESLSLKDFKPFSPCKYEDHEFKLLNDFLTKYTGIDFSEDLIENGITSVAEAIEDLDVLQDVFDSKFLEISVDFIGNMMLKEHRTLIDQMITEKKLFTDDSSLDRRRIMSVPFEGQSKIQVYSKPSAYASDVLEKEEQRSTYLDNVL